MLHELVAAKFERDRMRPVVAAARAWAARIHWNTPFSGDEEELALKTALDALGEEKP